mgnify:CR=1 FL=1
MKNLKKKINEIPYFQKKILQLVKIRVLIIIRKFIF